VKVKRPVKVAVTVGVTLPMSYVSWIVFVGTFSRHELLLGIGAALLTATGMVVVTMKYPEPFSPTVWELAAVWRLPWYLISGTWEIFHVAAKDLLGIQRAKSLFRVARFDAGEKNDPRATARRVLGVVYTTVAPNFIVVGVNTSDPRMLFHQIQRSSVPKMTKQLGAKA
jgi:hypothetical protein